jgi:cytoskeletal protein CcmA (bactofilin family)
MFLTRFLTGPPVARVSKVALLTIAGLLFCLASSTPASAASRGDPRSKFQRTTSYVVRSGETVDHDLYVMAEFVTIDGTVQGNLVALARQVIINGTVTGNLDTINAQTRISGTVGGDLRAASGVVTISGKVQGDVLAATVFLNVGRNGQISGDLIYAAPLDRIQGNVGGSVLSAQNAGGPPSGPTVYALSSPAAVPIAAAPTNQETAPSADLSAGLGILGQFLQRYISIVAIGSLMLLLFSGTMRDSALQAATHPLGSVGAGVLAVGACICGGIAVAFISVVLMAALLGGSLGFVLTMLAGGVAAAGLTILLLTTGVLLLFAAYAIVSLLAGGLLLGAGGRGKTLTATSETGGKSTRSRLALGAEQPFVSLLVGALVVAIFAALPGFAGYVVDIVVLLLGLGAAALAIRHRDVLVAAQVSIAESEQPSLLSQPNGTAIRVEAIEQVNESR